MRCHYPMRLSPDSHHYVRCGWCVGCRLSRSREWSVRCVREASLHDANSFVTLTYDNEHLPVTSDGLATLRKRDLQLFFKGLRNDGHVFRYFACGEYGDAGGRPHYHVCFFGLDADDKRPVGTRNGHRIYDSDYLCSVWSRGIAELGSLTKDSAGYTARYTMKKLHGLAGRLHYAEIGIEPPFLVMSRRPGLAADWYRKYRDDLYNHDVMEFEGTELSVPRYFDKLLEKDDPERLMKIKSARRKKRDTPSVPDYRELKANEEITETRVKQLPRKL